MEETLERGVGVASVGNFGDKGVRHLKSGSRSGMCTLNHTRMDGLQCTVSVLFDHHNCRPSDSSLAYSHIVCSRSRREPDSYHVPPLYAVTTPIASD